MPETAFRYLFVPLTPAGEAIRDLYVKQEQVTADYEGAINPLSGAPINPKALGDIRQFRVVISHHCCPSIFISHWGATWALVPFSCV